MALLSRYILNLVLGVVLLTLFGCAKGSGDLAAPKDSGTQKLDAAEDTLDDTPSEGGATPDEPSGDIGGCTTSEMCRSDPAGSLCDTATGRCVQCTQNSGCLGMNTRCDLATHTCVGCMSDVDCGPGTVCRKGACALGCNAEHPCGVGSTCCAGLCVNTQSDPMHCGACAAACPSDGSVCCAGGCALTATSTMHCGACGNACVALRAAPLCAAGSCSLGACEPGFGDCDRTVANGCESDLATDGMNCGSCGRACAAVMGASSRCMMGVCVVQCDSARGDCDGAMDNGCETLLGSDPNHCGMCARRCPAGANSAASCAMGACGVTCAPGFGDCDASPDNGCEVNLNTSALSCGVCGVGCRAANSEPLCASGVCRLGACNPGFSDCNSDPADGCEVSSSSDAAHCGACGRRCAPGTVCAMGACASVCPSGTVFCGGSCTQVERDVNHCGLCGRRCPPGANGVAVCASGACGLSCNPGFGDCNGSGSDGCEVSLRTDTVHCGACGAGCSRSNALAACSDGTCRISRCLSGYADCDGSDGSGCETNTLSDARSCGACGRACAVPNAMARCASGVCAVGSCVSGFSNCNGSDGDGCEVNLNADNLNCGGCGRLCPAGTACSGGVCTSVCSGGTSFCAGACVDTQTHGGHCGACGRACSGGQICRSGGCLSPGPPNDRCASAEVISMASPQANLFASTLGAVNDLAGPCGGGGAGDVFYRFTVPGPAPELVYADTVGMTYDSVLYFASNCGSALSGSTTPGDTVCNDDLGVTGCSSGGLQSVVVALFFPGTYYLVLDGYASGTGSGTLHFQHLPVGNGALNVLGAGATSPSGFTSGGGRVSGSCGGGSAPENTYWWRSCPESPGGTFSATTCSRAVWDTLIYLRNGNGVGNTCNDDACGSFQSSITSSVSSGAGLHALYIDGFGSNSGSYTVFASRP